MIRSIALGMALAVVVGTAALVVYHAVQGGFPNLTHQRIYGYQVSQWSDCDVDGDGIADYRGEICAVKYPETNGQWVTNHDETDAGCVWDSDDTWFSAPSSFCLRADSVRHLMKFRVCGKFNTEWGGRVTFSDSRFASFIWETGNRVRMHGNVSCEWACGESPQAVVGGINADEVPIPSDNGNGKYGYGIPMQVIFTPFGKYDTASLISRVDYDNAMNRGNCAESCSTVQLAVLWKECHR